MAKSKTLGSSSSNEQVRLLHLNLHTLTEDNIRTRMLEIHSRTDYSVLHRHPLFVSISHILKPATHFVDAVLLDKKVNEKGVKLENSDPQESRSTLNMLKLQKISLDKITRLMGEAIDRAGEMVDEINIDRASIQILESTSDKSWDEKAEMTMGSFVLKFVEFLDCLLHGPNQSSFDIASSTAALKKSPVSIVGTPFEKFEHPIDQLNCLIKITLELIQYI